MNEGWVKYTGDNPPTDTSKHVLWQGSKESTYHMRAGRPCSTDTAYSGLLGWRWCYVDPYVEPEPEVHEVLYLVKSDEIPGYYESMSSTYGKATRYRRCVGMDMREDVDRTCHCGVCDTLMATRDRFCPACGAEVKR